MKIKLLCLCFFGFILFGCTNYNIDKIKFKQESFIMKSEEVFNIKDIVDYLSDDLSIYDYIYNNNYLVEDSKGTFKVLVNEPIDFQMIDTVNKVEISTTFFIVPKDWTHFVDMHLNKNKTLELESMYDFIDIINDEGITFIMDLKYEEVIKYALLNQNFNTAKIGSKEIYFHQETKEFILYEVKIGQINLTIARDIKLLFKPNNNALIKGFNDLSMFMINSDYQFNITDFDDALNIKFKLDDKSFLNDSSIDDLLIKINENTYKFLNHNILLILEDEYVILKEYNVKNIEWDNLVKSIKDDYNLFFPTFINIEIIELNKEVINLNILNAVLKTNLNRDIEINNLFSELEKNGWILQEGSTMHLANFIHQDDDYYIIGIHESHGDEKFIEIQLNINNKYA